MGHLVVDRVSKAFGAIKALDGATLNIERGEIHAVLGENGAGKTTLMNILFGLYRPDEGTVRIGGTPVSFRAPSDAIRHGIGMIHQHFHLAEAMTVVENIILGRGATSSLTRQSHHAHAVCTLAKQCGFEVDPFAPVWTLPIGMRQRVEILKALYHGANILVLDEPTSVLAPNEVDVFLAALRRLKAAGTTILFVSHKLDEVMEVTDAVTVLRLGQAVAQLRTATTTPHELSRLMVGREMGSLSVKRDHPSGSVLLECEQLRARSARQTLALDAMSLTLRSGEILGIAGVDGNGQRELAEAIVGLRHLEAGRIVVDGRDISSLTVAQRMHQVGIGFIPEDRHASGLVLDQSIADNLVLRSFNRSPASRRGWMDRGALIARAADLMRRYDIRARSPEQRVRDLSGGNQQKIIIARELEASPRLLVVMQPTKGLDIGAINFVQRQLLEQRAKGAAVLYISTELEHVVEVADRISVIHRGRITGTLLPNEVTAERVGLLMSGTARQAT